MTDETKLIDEVLYSLKVPPKQTRQNKKSMRRSEKNIKRNLYDDVLKPLKNAKGGKIELPKAADLDGDGNFNEYETARGEAIQKAMAKEKVETASLGKAMSSKLPEMMSRFQADQKAKKEEEEKMFQEMVKREKAKYGNTQQMKAGGIAKGGGIAIKGLKFKGIF